jgi:hypothetical protein
MPLAHTRRAMANIGHRESTNPGNGPGEFPDSINHIRSPPSVIAIDATMNCVYGDSMLCRSRRWKYAAG